MTLEEMEGTLARLDVMLGMLKRQLYKGIADPRATPQAIARYQRLRDELNVQIGLERIRRWTYRPRARRLQTSWKIGREQEQDRHSSSGQNNQHDDQYNKAIPLLTLIVDHTAT
jgi:hypothetical protein